MPILDTAIERWENPTMKVVKVDSKKRIVLSDSKPGDLMAVEETADGTYTLTQVRLPARKRMSKSAVQRAMTEKPVDMSVSWEELRKQTREP